MTARVAAAAVGPGGYLRLPDLIRLLQEAAMRNTVRLGISSPELMAEAGVSWVLRRQYITAYRWPRMGDEVRVTTAPSGFARRLLTYRDFHVTDAGGQPLIGAVSEWLLMNVASRRVTPIPPRIAALATDLAPASAHLPHPTGKLTAPTGGATAAFRVAYHQLDFNDHLTNPVFPELMLEPLGHAWLSGHLPLTVDVAFHREARYGEEITARVATEGTLTRHVLARNGDELAVMHTRWRPRP